MWTAFISLWKNIFNYRGTASRKDFWLGSIMNIIAMYVGLIPIAILFLLLNAFGVLHLISPITFSIIYICIFLVPLLSLYVRRANDVGLRKTDIVLIAVATPIIGAIILGIYPSEFNSAHKKLPGYVRSLAVGFGLYFYGGFTGILLWGSPDAKLPIVGTGLLLTTFSIIYGAIKQR